MKLLRQKITVHHRKPAKILTSCSNTRSRLGRVLAQVGVGLSALPLVKAGLWLAGDEVFTSEADYKLQQDCTLDSVQFRALNGSERGLWPQVTHVIRLACVLDGLLLQCLERRLRGSETSADATAIESHLITRLAQLVVHRQGHRINVTYVTEVCPPCAKNSTILCPLHASGMLIFRPRTILRTVTVCPILASSLS